MGLSTEDLDQIAAMIRNSRNSDRPLKADVDSASDDFSNTDQVNAGDLTEQIANIRMNKKRTYDSTRTWTSRWHASSITSSPRIWRTR